LRNPTSLRHAMVPTFSRSMVLVSAYSSKTSRTGNGDLYPKGAFLGHSLCLRQVVQTKWILREVGDASDGDSKRETTVQYTLRLVLCVTCAHIGYLP
jgi:hypothetical protein